MASDNAQLLRDLHSDLARKYRTHGPTVERVWRSLNKLQRARCFKAGAAGGVVLQHAADTSLGNVHKIVPELNLEDIARPQSDLLLQHIEHRATASLTEQYRSGLNGRLGDHGFICKMMAEKGLRSARSYTDCYTLFIDDETYGNSIEIATPRDQSMLALAPAIQAQLIVPQSMGELIVMRQVNLLQVLNIIIEDILEAGSDRKDHGAAPKKTVKPASQALPRLTSAQAPPKLTITDIAANAREQQCSLEDYLYLLLHEPLALAHAVNTWFFSRPELLADEKGRRAPVHTDKFISPVLCEAIQDTIRGVSVWRYINMLLRQLEDPGTDRALRTIVQQELVNAYYIEYTRAQGNFKRFVQTNSGEKWFKRLSSVQDKTGAPRVTFRKSIEPLFGTNPQLYYILHLCQLDLSPSEAMEWISKLSDLHRSYPQEEDKLHETEVDGLGDLAVVIALIRDCGSALSLPPVSRRAGQTLTSNIEELNLRIAEAKKSLDLRDFVVPIDNILEDGAASKALKAMDQYFSDRIGASMTIAYEDTISKCAAELADRYQQIKAKLGKQNFNSAPPFSLAPEPFAFPAEPRREKEKRRGPEPDNDEKVAEHSTPAGNETPTPTLQVKAASARTFSIVFGKEGARGSVSWVAFVAAMVGAGFSVVPKLGSVVTFFPPSTMPAEKAITLHRPHHGQLEGYRLLFLTRRLSRHYGWGRNTFCEAERLQSDRAS